MVDIKDRVLLICKTTHEVAAVGFLSCYLNDHINITANAIQSYMKCVDHVFIENNSFVG